MKQFFTFLLLFIQLIVAGQNLKMTLTHEDNLMVFFESQYGARIDFQDGLFIDSCQYVPKLWMLTYDSTYQRQWQQGRTVGWSGDGVDISNASYYTPNSSRFFYGGDAWDNSPLPWTPILEINHQTGAFSPIIGPQTTVDYPSITGVNLETYTNDDWVISGTYFGGDFYFGDTSNYHFINTASFDYHGFIVNFDVSNQVNWSNEIKGDVYLATTKVAPNQMTYVAGAHYPKYTTTLGNQSILGDSTIDRGYFNGFVGKIDTTGATVMLKPILQNIAEQFWVEDIHITSDAYYLTGMIQDTATFDSLAYQNLTGCTFDNTDWAFLAKYDLLTDSLLWVTHTESDGRMQVTASTMDDDGNIYLGLLSSSLWTIDSTQFYNGKYSVAKFDSTGQLICVQNLSPTFSSYFTSIQDLMVNQQGEVLGIVGDIEGDNSVLIFSITDCQYVEIDDFFYQNCFNSTKEEELKIDVDIFPNPTRDIVNITIRDENFRTGNCQIFAINGKQMLEKRLVNIEEKINLEKLPTGVYLLKITTEEGIVTRKLVKQ